MTVKKLNILGSIDLSKIEKKPRIDIRKASAFLDGKIKDMSQELNDSYGPLFNSDASIKMKGVESSQHQDLVEQKEKLWASDMRLSLAEWKEKRELNPSNIAEKLITFVLQEKLKDRFFVARSSTYDDYENGVDYVLMDKETGAVVCGFDQVLGMGADDGSAKKKAKMEKVLKRGGARLEYGLALDSDKKVLIKKLRNVPAFFLALSKKDLDQALLNLGTDQESSIASEILKKIVESLEEQKQAAQALLDNTRCEDLIKNIDNFSQSLDLIKARI